MGNGINNMNIYNIYIYLVYIYQCAHIGVAVPDTEASCLLYTHHSGRNKISVR